MSLESGNTIEALVSTNPQMIDPVYAGANHFWLLKTVLKHIFPGASGNGFNTPITVTESEINRLHGVSSNVQDQITAAQTDASTALARILPILKADGTTIVKVSLGNP